MSLSVRRQTHGQIKSRFPSDVNVITSLEGDGRSEVLSACKPSRPHAPASPALSHGPNTRHNPESTSWHQQQEEMGKQELLRLDWEVGRKVYVYKL